MRPPDPGVSVRLTTTRRARTAPPARLSHLDGQTAPTGRVVVASVRGRLQAAVDADGHAISDPFTPTEDLVALLRLRVRQLRAH